MNHHQTIATKFFTRIKETSEKSENYQGDHPSSGSNTRIGSFIFTLIFFYFAITGPALVQEDLIIFDFSRPDILKTWKAAVLSECRRKADISLKLGGQDTVVFSGRIEKSDCSVSCLIISPVSRRNLRSFGGLLIRLKGDGRYYRVLLFNRTTGPDVSYRAGFNTRQGRLDTIFLPFSAFVPYHQDRLVRDWPALDQSNIVKMAILADDRQPGPFRLELSWIKAVSY